MIKMARTVPIAGGPSPAAFLEQGFWSFVLHFEAHDPSDAKLPGSEDDHLRRCRGMSRTGI